MNPPFTLEAMQQGDWPRVRAIYAEGLAKGLAAFQLTPPLWKDWDHGHLQAGRLVARRDQRVLGWAALAPVADS